MEIERKYSDTNEILLREQEIEKLKPNFKVKFSIMLFLLFLVNLSSVLNLFLIENNLLILVTMIFHIVIFILGWSYFFKVKKYYIEKEMKVLHIITIVLLFIFGKSFLLSIFFQDNLISIIFSYFFLLSLFYSQIALIRIYALKSQEILFTEYQKKMKKFEKIIRNFCISITVLLFVGLFLFIINDGIKFNDIEENFYLGFDSNEKNGSVLMAVFDERSIIGIRNNFSKEINPNLEFTYCERKRLMYGDHDPKNITILKKVKLVNTKQFSSKSKIEINSEETFFFETPKEILNFIKLEIENEKSTLMSHYFFCYYQLKNNEELLVEQKTYIPESRFK